MTVPGAVSTPISCSICSTAFIFFEPRDDGSFKREDLRLVPEVLVSGNLIPADSNIDASFDRLFDDMIPPENADFFFDDFLSPGVPTPDILMVDVDESACAISFCKSCVFFSLSLFLASIFFSSLRNISSSSTSSAVRS